MSRGIIYVMTTIVPGLIKIGKTQTGQYESRMRILETNGYQNVAGLKRIYAKEVDRYDEKERMLDKLFSKSRVANTELFAADERLVIELLEAFDGRQIYPCPAVPKAQGTGAYDFLPDGDYAFTNRRFDGEQKHAVLRVANGSLTLLKGSDVTSPRHFASEKPESYAARQRRFDALPKQGGVLTDDVPVGTPSSASAFVSGQSVNGWMHWHDANGKTLDEYRNSKEATK